MKAGFFRNFRRKTEREKSSGSRGSITVLVTLILVPMVVVNSFMVDLSRLKLYGNQAVMTADAYGEAILSSYDNILKEMYGIFALSDEAAPDGNLAGYLQEYMGSSFNPNKNTILFGYFRDIQDQFHRYSGFMPYKDAEVALSHQRVEQSVLVSKDSAAVLASQIGDFMKFRIVQMFLNGENSLMEAYEFVKGMEANANVITHKREFDEKAQELLEQMEIYYNTLTLLHKYVNMGVGKNTTTFVEESSSQISTAWSEIKGYSTSGDYLNYKEVKPMESTYRSRYEQDSGDEGMTCGYCSMCSAYEQYMDGFDRNGVHKVEKQLYAALETPTKYLSVGESHTFKNHPLYINFETYDDTVQMLKKSAEEISDLYSELQRKRSSVENALRQDNVAEDLKSPEHGIPKEMEKLDELLSKYSAQYYMDIADIYESNNPLNTDWGAKAEESLDLMEMAISGLLECSEDYNEGYYDEELQKRKPDTSDFQKYTENPTLSNLYTQLKEIFESGSDKTAKEKGDKATDKANSIDNELNNELPAITPRDVPLSSMGDIVENPSNFKTSSILGGDLFKADGLKTLGIDLFLKFYVVQYGFGMFSSRVTNMEKPDKDNGSVTDAVGDAADAADDLMDAADDLSDAADDVADAADGDSGDSEEIETSLTGYHKCRSINYLYGAELEYLYGGHQKSIQNLNDVRNLILTFRTIMNFIATYTVKPVNSAIETISTACTHPVLKLAVAAALRLGVTAVETAADWDLLKNRNSAVVLKNEIVDLSVVRAPGSKLDDIADLLPGMSSEDGVVGEGKTPPHVKLDYEQYLTLMLLLTRNTEILTQRVGNLISMNISGVRAGVGESVEKTLTENDITFDPHTAYTAVDSTCSVQLDFAVIPPGMAAWLLGEEGFSRLQSYSNNTYTFTVTRGY